MAKGFCIILVVLHHVCQAIGATYPLWLQANSFRMPLYFILSGLFFKQYEGFKGFLRRKTNKLLIPFLFFFLLTSVLPFAVLEHGFSLPLLFTYREIIYNVPIWFLLCLFEINILFYLIQWFVNTLIPKGCTALVIAIAFALGVVGMCLGVYQVQLPLYCDTALSALPLFVFGWWLNRKTSFLRQPSRWVDLLIIVACAVVIGLFAAPIQWLLNSFTRESVWFVYLCGIAGTVMVLLISRFLKHLPLVSYWGRYSIIILCTHFPIANVLSALLSRVMHGTMLLVVALALTMAVCHLLIPLMRKFLPYFTAQKDFFRL